jgi:hypothetical protein
MLPPPYDSICFHKIDRKTGKNLGRNLPPKPTATATDNAQNQQQQQHASSSSANANKQQQQQQSNTQQPASVKKPWLSPPRFSEPYTDLEIASMKAGYHIPDFHHP